MTMQTVYNLLRSTRVTALLMAALLLLFTLGLVIPQKAILGPEGAAALKQTSPSMYFTLDSLGLLEIYTSALAVVLLSLFFINLLFVFAHRWPIALKRCALPRSDLPRSGLPWAGFPSSEDTGDQPKSVDLPRAGFSSGEDTADQPQSDDLPRAGSFSSEDTADQPQSDDLPRSDLPDQTGGLLSIDIRGSDPGLIVGFLRTRLKDFNFIADRDNRAFVAVSNRYAPLGLLLFHLSFLLMLVGGLALLYTRSVGTAVLTEGQDFFSSQWTTLKPPHLGSAPDVLFSVMDIRPGYEQGTPVAMDVDLAVYGDRRVGNSRTFTVGVNRPAVLGDTSILIRNVGVSPLLRFFDDSAQVYEYAYVSLNVLDGRSDGYSIPYTAYRMDFEFYPDYAIDGGVEFTRTHQMRNPVFHVYLYDQEHPIFNGTVGLGETVSMDGMNLTVEDIRYWGEFLVVREKGRIPLILGFILCVGGLLWRFFFNRTEVLGSMDGSTLMLAVRGGNTPMASRDLADSLNNGLGDFLKGGYGNA